METGLNIRLFGALEVTVCGRPMPRLRSRKGQWLLAMLCLKRGTEVGREWLAGNLWPDSDMERAAANLRLSLCDLRRALGPEGCRLESPTSRTLRLDLDGCAVDLATFDAALARGDAASLEEAVSLYRGPLLEECTEPWADLERRQREQAYLTTLESLGAAALDTGDLAGAEHYLHRALQVDPLRERTYIKLMQVLAMRGDVAAAMQVYRDLRLLLREELNTEPGSEAQAAYRSLRDVGNRPPAQPPAPAAAVRRGPEPAGAAHRLPRPLTEFVGREHEVSRVMSLSRQNRLVTLTGPGGIGKTRLAIEAAQNLSTDFADGVRFIDLAPAEDGVLVSSVILNAAGTQGEEDKETGDLEEIGPANRNLLLVVDSCEHVIEACAETVDSLLARTPGLHVIATSRQALGITGEVDWRLQPLSLSAADAGTEQIAQSEAVRLFLQRAQSARPDFALTDANARTIADVCNRLDGIPLALELAAARLKILSIEQVAAKLEDRFALLSAGSRSALPRHRTLEAALDWSYALLSEAERLLLRRLAGFPGRFDIEAADAVCGGPDLGDSMLNLLGQLADKSLVAVEEEAGEACYRLLESTRAYARARTEPGADSTLLREQHAAYFLGYAERAGPLLRSSQAAKWLDRLATRSDDFRVALAWYAEQGTAQGSEAGLRLANALWPFWHTRHDMGDLSMRSPQDVWTEAAVWLEKLLSGNPPICAATAKAQVHLAMLAIRRDMPERAIRLFGQSLAICESLGDLAMAASTHRSLASLSVDSGDLEQARALLDNALDLSRRSQDLAEIASSLNARGALEYRTGDVALSRKLMEEALLIQRELGHPLGISGALTNVGLAATAMGDWGASRSAHLESLRINEDLKHVVGIAWSLDNLAEVALAESDIDRASELYRSSAEIFHSLAHRSGLADCLVGTAEICLTRNAPAAARLLSGAASLRHRRSHVSAQDQQRFDRLMRETEAVLGPESFSQAQEQGRRMSLDDALGSIQQLLADS